LRFPIVFRLLAAWLICVLLTRGATAQTTGKEQTPRILWVLSPDKMTPAEQALAQTVQGLANREQARLWIRTPGMSALLLSELQAEGTRVEELPTVWDAARQFRKSINGLVLYKIGTHSLNAATSLCGLLDGVAVEEALLEKARAEGLKVLADARGLDEAQILSRYRSQFGRGIAVEQGTDKPGHLRDWAVSHRAFTYSTTDSVFRTQVARTFGPDALVYGWGDDEFRFVRDISRANGTTIPADWLRNLSALEHLPIGKLVTPRRPDLKTEDGVRYVAFVVSDGDNIQWLCGNFPLDTGFWANPHRGQFPMTWEVAPILGQVAPRALRYLYAHATPNDAFVTGAGVPGYTYPYFQPNKEAIARQAAGYLRMSDVSIASVLNANEGDMRDTIPILERPEVAGVLYKDYAPYNRRKGEILWHKGKPCVAYKFLMWEGVQSMEEMAQGVAQMPASPHTDQGSYALIQVHAWSYRSIGGPMEAIARAIPLLPPNTRVVTAPDLIALLRANFGKTNGVAAK
jgi:hypothetical protein